MTEQGNLGFVREVFAAWNAHDPDRLAQLVDEKWWAESDTFPEPAKGREGLQAFLRTYVTAFPDLRLDIDQAIASGDFVVTRWTASGTHRGPLMGIPPTNRRTVTHGCTVAEFKNGKSVHDWIYWDTGNLLRQLGVLPASNER